MITSREILSLCEKWHLLIPSPFKGENAIDIYSNPSTSDLVELRKQTIYDVRFIADGKSKTLYIWNGEAILHSQAAKHLGLSNRIAGIPDNILLGTASISGGKLVARYSDNLYMMIKDLLAFKSEINKNSYLRKRYDYLKNLGKNFNWISRYMDLSEITNMIDRNL